MQAPLNKTFDAHFTLLGTVLNAPGSWHDSRVARRLYRKLREVPDGYFLIADTAFPRTPASAGGKIKAPLKSGDDFPVDPAAQAEVFVLNRQLLLYR